MTVQKMYMIITKKCAAIVGVKRLKSEGRGRLFDHSSNYNYHTFIPRQNNNRGERQCVRYNLWEGQISVSICID